MSGFINTMSSRTEYTLLSIEENNDENSVFIVDIMVCVIDDWVSCKCGPPFNMLFELNRLCLNDRY